MAYPNSLPQPAGGRVRWQESLQQRWGTSRLASLGLVVVLILLPSFALWGAISTYRSGEAARAATAISDTLEEARYQVGAEESLERKYRLEPSAEVRQRHRDAAASMVAALQRAQAQISASNSASLTQVILKHTEYLGAIELMFAAIDAGDTVGTQRIDSDEIDPLFDEIEGQVLNAATTSRQDADRHLDDLAHLQTAVTVATPIVFFVGLGLVIFFWRVLRSYQATVKNAAERSEQRYRLLVQNSSDVVLICSPSGTVTYESPISGAASRLASDTLTGKSIFSLLHCEDQVAARALFKQVLDAPDAKRRNEIRVSDSVGNWRYAELIVTNLMHENAVAGIVATIHDINERKEFERQLTQQAFYDSLTGLPNRALFRDRLDQALARTGGHFDSVGVIFLDLDNFKLINDSLGHHVGDALLLAAAKRLRYSIRKEDTVARLGGDEFVIILENLTAETDMLVVAKSIVEQFAQPFLLDGRSVVVTASVGIAIGDTTGTNADGLLRNADLAMYRAKADGKGRHVVFHKSMQADSLARLELENDLRQALEGQQLLIQYQPIVSLISGKVIEFEALVRWQHPTRGLIAPLEFIPIAEETGLIGAIGMWVLQQACHQAVEWQERFSIDPPIVMGVNLSPKQFQDCGDLVEMVARTLEQTGLPPASLKLEITEGVVMRDIETSIETLRALKNLGVQIAIDDFGTGYSSLAYLKRLPLDVLKIDRAFIIGLGQTRQDDSIVLALLSLANSLGLTVTAEGIETAEQAATLESWTCDRGQGFHFFRPLDTSAATALLQPSITGAVTEKVMHVA